MSVERRNTAPFLFCIFASMKTEYPFKECEICKVLDDCPCPDVTDDCLSMPMPPDECPKPIETMKRTREKHKLNKAKNQ